MPGLSVLVRPGQREAAQVAQGSAVPLGRAREPKRLKPDKSDKGRLSAFVFALVSGNAWRQQNRVTAGSRRAHRCEMRPNLRLA